MAVGESGRRKYCIAQTGVVAVAAERAGGVTDCLGARSNVSDNVVTCDVGGSKVFTAVVGAWHDRGGKDTLLDVPFDVC